jgi:hypothetical protein
MVKIQSVKKGQPRGNYRVVIPKDITDIMGWDDTTELLFIPYLVNPLDPITPNTPILIKKVLKVDTKGDDNSGNNTQPSQ